MPYRQIPDAGEQGFYPAEQGIFAADAPPAPRLAQSQKRVQSRGPI
jgi:hypothetical protein